MTGTTSSALAPSKWARPTGISHVLVGACLEMKGEAARFSRLMGVSRGLISKGQHFEKTPSFQKVLEICYAIDISPLQLMSDPASMRNAIQAISDHPRR